MKILLSAIFSLLMSSFVFAGQTNSVISSATTFLFGADFDVAQKTYHLKNVSAQEDGCEVSISIKAGNLVVKASAHDGQQVISAVFKSANAKKISVEIDESVLTIQQKSNQNHNVEKVKISTNEIFGSDDYISDLVITNNGQTLECETPN